MSGKLVSDLSQNQGGPNVCPAGLEVFPPGYTHCPTHNVELTQQSQDALLGKRLGEGNRYQIVESLSWGGWASIYRAVDHKSKMELAIKVMHSHLSNDGEAVGRFRREAKAAASLSHPGLARVYDAGVLPDGQPYIVMEYVHGMTLAERIATLGALTAEQAVPLFVQTADGLAAAHAAGIIHRDIKPSNLMLSYDENKQLHVKLVDFGLARAMENSGLDFDQITRTGQTLGSPAYMSPEQCLGYKLDARSDIYALGCTMYEAVAGHPPFTANSILEYMHKHTYEAPPQLEIHSEEPNFGYNLAHVIMQALSKAPEERQQSMAQLRDQLQCCVWDEKEAAEKLPPLPPPPPPPQPQKPRRTAFTQLRVLISNLTPLVVLLIVIALGVFVVRNNPLQLGAPETSQSRSLDEQSPSTAVNHHRTTHGVSHH